MSATKSDYEFYKGWRSGYERAIEDIRQELLTLEQDKGAPVSLEIYEILNQKAKQIRGEAEHRKADIPRCETEEDLVFNNID